MLPQRLDAKLDGDLLEQFENTWAPNAQFPVIITATEDQIERVVSLVHEKGSLRHVIWPLNAVSAWLSLEMIQSIAQFDSVAEIELCQKVAIADA